LDPADLNKLADDLEVDWFNPLTGMGSPKLHKTESGQSTS